VSIDAASKRDYVAVSDCRHETQLSPLFHDWAVALCLCVVRLAEHDDLIYRHTYCNVYHTALQTGYTALTAALLEQTGLVTAAAAVLAGLTAALLQQTGLVTAAAAVLAALTAALLHQTGLVT
jgi:hypothetical protein